MTTNKLRPAKGDVWRFEHTNYSTTIKLTDVRKSWGVREERWHGDNDRGESECAGSEHELLSKPAWTLVRPAGCPEGFVPCSRGCGRWTRKYDHERGDWCYTCLGNRTHDFTDLDWTPPAERRIVEPAVTPPPVRPAGCPEEFLQCVRGCGRWTSKGNGDRGSWCYTCLGRTDNSRFLQYAYLDWTPPAAVTPPPAITGDLSVPPAPDPLAARLKDAEDSLGAFQRAQCRVNDSVMVSLKDLDRRLEALVASLDGRLKALETRFAPAAPCSGLCCNPVPMPQPCWAAGPCDSRCLRDPHGGDGHHRFGMTLGFRS